MFTLEVLGPKFTKINMIGTYFWFSYNTCVAFMSAGVTVHAATDKNGRKWSNSTMKHLNRLPKADEVLPWPEFVVRCEGAYRQAM